MRRHWFVLLVTVCLGCSVDIRGKMERKSLEVIPASVTYYPVRVCGSVYFVPGHHPREERCVLHLRDGSGVLREREVSREEYDRAEVGDIYSVKQ